MDGMKQQVVGAYDAINSELGKLRFVSASIGGDSGVLLEEGSASGCVSIIDGAVSAIKAQIDALRACSLRNE